LRSPLNGGAFTRPHRFEARIENLRRKGMIPGAAVALGTEISLLHLATTFESDFEGCVVSGSTPLIPDIPRRDS
jgi:hypothetical protein